MEFKSSNTYYVLPSDMADDISLDALADTSYTTMRKSLDGTMTIVEYKGNIQVKGGKYLTHEEALALMQTADWFIEEEGAP